MLQTIIEKIMSQTDYDKTQLIGMIEKVVDNVNGLLNPVGAALIIADKLNVNVDDTYDQEYKLEVKDNMTKIEDINDDEYENINLRATVSELGDERTVNTRYGETTVRDVTIKDDTGEIVFVYWRPEKINIGNDLEFFNAYTKEDTYGGNTTYKLNISKKQGGVMINHSVKPKKKSGSKKTTTKKSSTAAKKGGSTSTADVKAFKKYIDKKIKNLDESLSESIAGAFVKLEDIDEITRNIMKQLKIIVKHGGIPEIEDEPEEEDEFEEDDGELDGDDEPEEDDDTETDDE